MQSHFSSQDGSLVKPADHRMFETISKTWNPVVGCLHSCSYCWAAKLVKTRLKNSVKYKEGFSPKIAESELGKRFHNQFVFVSDMGDLFGFWVPSEWIMKVLGAVRRNSDSLFLFLTKNPARYREFVDLFPKNVVLGVTLESNREYSFTKAPSPFERYRSMASIKFDKKLVCIEPIIDFDLETFVKWIKDIRPSTVYVGYDNYHNRLPEPSRTKTEQLIDQLTHFTKVRTKF